MLSKTLEYDDTIPHERRLSLQLIQTKSQSSPERNHESSAKSLRDVPINLPFDNSLMEKEKEIINLQIPSLKRFKSTNNDLTWNPMKLKKKIHLSEQISQPLKNNPSFEEPSGLSEFHSSRNNIKLNFTNLKSGKSSKSGKTSKSSEAGKGHKEKKFKLKKKPESFGKSIQSSGLLLGVIKTVKKFVENLKFQLIYSDYKNLDSRHYELINDRVADINSQESIRLNSYKTFKSMEQRNKGFQFNFDVFKMKSWEALMKAYKIYDKIAFKINPDHMAVMFWHFFLMVFLIIFMILIPLNICFDNYGVFDDQTESGSLYFTFVHHSSAFLLSIDIVFCFHLGYYEQGAKILDRKQIIKRYFGKKFFCDLLALMPFLFISAGLTKDDHYFELFFFLKVFRLNEILVAFEAKLCLNDFYEGIFNLIKVVCKILYIAHIIGCIFHIIGSYMIHLHDKSWLNLINPMYLNDWTIRYIYSIYWSVTTLITVGYGDFTPQNQYEVMFTIFVILIGCGTFAYGINSVGSILTMMKKKDQEFQKEVKILNNFMQKNNLNSDLQTRLREYFVFISKEENSEDLEKEQVIINKLSNSLQHEVILNTTGQALKKMKLFSYNFSELFLQKLVLKMKQKRFVPEEIIFEEESQENSIFFIVKGKIELFINEISLSIIDKDQCFNEIPLITNKLTNYGAKSVGYTSVFYIQRKELLDLLKDFPADLEKFCEIKDKIMLYNDIEALHGQCELCGKMTHFKRQCPFVNFHINYWNALKKYQNTYKYIQNERKTIQRRKFNVNFRSAKKLYKENTKLNRRRVLMLQTTDKDKEDEYYDYTVNQDSQESSSLLLKKASSNTDFNYDNYRAKDKCPSIIMDSQKNVLICSRENPDEIGFIPKDETKDLKETNEYILSSGHYFLEDKSIKKNMNDLYWINFEQYKHFEFYFPKNNISHVVGKLRRKNTKNTKNKTVQNSIFSGTLEKNKGFLSPPHKKSTLKKGLRNSFFKTDSLAKNILQFASLETDKTRSLFSKR